MKCSRSCVEQGFFHLGKLRFCVLRPLLLEELFYLSMKMLLKKLSCMRLSFDICSRRNCLVVLPQKCVEALPFPFHLRILAESFSAQIFARKSSRRSCNFFLS